MRQNEQNFVTSSCTSSCEKRVFFENCKNTVWNAFVWPLQKIPLKHVPKGYFLPHRMNGAFSALWLLKSPLWLRLGLLYAQDIKHMVFTVQDGPHPSKTLGKCTLLLSACLAGSAAESSLGAILGALVTILGQS